MANRGILLAHQAKLSPEKLLWFVFVFQLIYLKMNYHSNDLGMLEGYSLK